ncbi:MAG: TolC family protein [Deltaproteobacteria bacterium]|nr:TolC family protein [Deltaproteobacteria bacterium]
MIPIMHNRLSPILAILAGWIAQTVYAEPMDEEGAIARAAKNNPDLRAALLDLRSARQAEAAAEAEYVPVVRITPGVTHSETPNATVEGVTTGSSEAVDVGLGLAHRLSWGTQLSIDVTGSAGMRRGVNPQVTTRETVELGPTYGLEARAGVSQPLLRDAGNDVGEASLRSAQSRRRGAEHGRDKIASELLRDVLSGYWELWYCDSALQVYVRDREVALQQYTEAQQRVDLGTIAASDALSYATGLASLDESLEQSRATYRGAAIDLGRLLGIDPESASRLEIEPPADVLLSQMTPEQAAERARKSSEELREIETEIEVAREQVRVADDASQARLDLDAYVSARGLGYQDAVDPLEQVGTLSAVSAHLGLTFEFPFSNVQRRSQLAKARLDLEAARARFEARARQIEANAAKQVEQLRAASQRVVLAQRTVGVAQQLAAAESERFEIGTATPLQVLQAQEDLRGAELRHAKARADQAKAAFALLHLTADLLSRYADYMKGL